MKVSDKALELAQEVGLKCQGDFLACLRAAIDSLPEPPKIDWHAERELFAAQVADEVCATLSRANLLTDEDLRLIREHVRPKDAGDAVEAAVLAERIRCARVAQCYGATATVSDILSGREVVP